MGITTSVISLDNEAELAALREAVANAKTPHAGQSKPGVLMVFAGKVKPGTTPQQIRRAMREGNVRPTDSPSAIADALRKANLLEE